MAASDFRIYLLLPGLYVFTVGFMTDPKHYDKATWKKVGGNQSAVNVWEGLQVNAQWTFP
jgi:hypothetical protein